MKQTPPVGTATVAGLTAALTAYVLAVLAVVDGDRSVEAVSALVSGTAVLCGVLWGRYRQAVESQRNEREVTRNSHLRRTFPPPQPKPPAIRLTHPEPQRPSPMQGETRGLGDMPEHERDGEGA
jgi:hypothetical protein